MGRSFGCCFKAFLSLLFLSTFILLLWELRCTILSLPCTLLDGGRAKFGIVIVTGLDWPRSNELLPISLVWQEWERPKPGRRPDIFPQFSPMKTPLPLPLPADPPEEDEEEEEKKEEEEEDPEKEEPDKPEKPASSLV